MPEVIGLVPSFAARDVDAAAAFYREVVGLDVVEVPLGVGGADVPFGIELRSPVGVRVMVYPKPDHEPAAFTVLTL